MALRVARGLFRLWIVGTALFVLGIAFVGYSDIKAEFDAVASMPKLPGPSSLLANFRQRHPQYKDWNDTQLADALYMKFYSNMPREQFDKKITTTNIKVVEYKGELIEFPADATEEQIAAALASHSKPGMFDDLIPPALTLPPNPPNPWASVGRVAGIAFGIPLAVLTLGASLVWAFSGFSTKRT
jgi:hypothetical protein